MPEAGRGAEPVWVFGGHLGRGAGPGLPHSVSHQGETTVPKIRLSSPVTGISGKFKGSDICFMDSKNGVTYARSAGEGPSSAAGWQLFE